MDFTLTVPDEILLHIFSDAQYIDRPYTTPRTGYSLPPLLYLGWINVTFVSRRWRRVAINGAMLWTSIDGALGPYWVREFTRRSKDTPLIVDGRHFCAKNMELSLRELVSAHHTRFATMRIDVISGITPAVSFIDTITPHMFHNLQELNFEGANMSPRNTESCNSLLKRAPCLRRLALYLPGMSYIDFDWKYPFFRQLTSLNLGWDNHRSNLISSHFFDVLRQMNALTRLLLKHTDSSRLPITSNCDSSCLSTSGSFVHLNKVQSLILMTPMEMQAHLLRHIRLPSDARVSLASDPSFYAPVETSPYEALAQSLHGFLNLHTEARQFSSAYILFAYSRVILGLARTKEPCYPCTDRRVTMFTHDQLSGEDLTVPLLDRGGRLPAILRCLSTHTIRTLTLYDAGVSHAEAHLSFFPNVEHLSLRANPRADRKSMYGLRSLVAEPGLLPALRVVEMHGDLYGIWLYYRDNFASPTGFPSLEDVLEVRKEMGTPLKAIYLCVAEEVALVSAGRISETSCEKLPKAIVDAFIRRLEAMQSVEIVGADLDTFAL